MSISIHTSHCWAVPCQLRLPRLVQRDEWPTTCSWHPGKRQHPRLWTLIPGERTHQAGGFPCAIVSCTTLPKPVEWLPVASLCQIAHTSVNAVTFLRLALRQTTHTLFCLQGTMRIFSHRCQKVEMAWVKTVRETRLTTATRSGEACGGFRKVKPKLLRTAFMA
jgi:hypothetical protein